MKLDDEQKKKVAQWIQDGLKLADIQKKLDKEMGITMTYMDVRFLVDDLKLMPKDPPPPPKVPEPPVATANPAAGGPVNQPPSDADDELLPEPSPLGGSG